MGKDTDIICIGKRKIKNISVINNFYKMNASRKIELLLNHLQINAKAFSERLGYDRPQVIYDVQKGRTKRISEDLAIKITSVFPEVNRVWLLTGEGDMLRSDGRATLDEASREPSASRVRLLPLFARGGSLSDFAASVKDSDCEMVVSPIMGADFAIQVNGDSMSPEYPSSSTILIKRINENAFIEWGKAYVLDTENGSVVKLVVKSDKEGYIRCQSINPDPRYAPFDVPLSSVFGIYRVLMCMSMK